jgi:hypothetical protein
MSRQGKDRPSKPKKAPATRAFTEPPVNQSTGAPLIVAVILIAAIAVGLGYSLFKRNHEPDGITLPAGTSLDLTPAPIRPAGTAAPADSAAPQKFNTYGASTLIN